MIARLALKILSDLRVRQNQKTPFVHGFDNFVRNLFRPKNSVNIVTAESTINVLRIVFDADHSRRDRLWTNDGNLDSLLSMRNCQRFRERDRRMLGRGIRGITDLA